MVSFADKLRQVVTANFVEISRPDTSAKDASTAKNASTAKAVPEPAAPATAAPPPAGARLPEPPVPAVPAASPSVNETAVAGNSPAAPEPERPQVTASTGDEPVSSAAFLSEEDTVTVTVAPESPDEETAETEADLSESEAAGEALAEPRDEAEPETLSGAVRPDVMGLVGDDGSIEFDQVFARAEVPAVTGFTAEQALSMLHSMPSDLPLRVKRLTVKATLDAVGQAVGATPAHIVADAGHKISTLETFIREVSDRANELRIAEDDAIESLRKQIAEKEAEKAAITRREELVFLTCRAKIGDLDQVVAFFTSGETDVPSTRATAEADVEAEPDTDELPAYLQEDAVKRLLGLNKEVEGTGDTELGTVGARTQGSRTRR